MDLFEQSESENLRAAMPLAARMRPQRLADLVGQQHLLGEGKLLRRMIDAGRVGSIILFGPPGTGKTTIAHLLAVETNAAFRQISAVSGGVKEVREAMQWARDRVAVGDPRPTLFVDEIHRFSKSQQDALLPDVEAGIVTLVGATTANPFFAVNAALLSRSQLFQLQPLAPEEIEQLLRRALDDPDNGLGKIATEAEPAALTFLAKICEGDARRALSALEVAVLSSRDQQPVRLTEALARESVQQKQVGYDGTGDDHYDLASALIKSLRGSDVDAAIYWLARMLEGGEDIRFVCRRLVILASEDIGNADPHALPLAVSCMQACEFVGLPECQLTLSQCVAYLALAPKSNAATTAIGQARRDVREGQIVPVPKHLRDAHYSGAQQLDHGTDYVYSHEAEEGIAAQEYLGVDRTYYHPTDRGHEADLAARLKQIRARLKGSTAP